MTSGSSNTWQDQNQRQLSAALVRLRRLLEAPDQTAEQFVDGVGTTSGSALEHLCASFQLTPFERDLLLLCAGVELDTTLLQAVVRAGQHGGPPTFGFALASLPDPHWSALSPAGPLRRWRLLELGEGPALVASPLRIDERVLHFLTGASYFDERLQGLAIPVQPSHDLPTGQAVAAKGIAAAWDTAGAGGRLAVIVLAASRATPPAAADAASVAAQACRAMGSALYRLDYKDIPSSPAERELLARLWERESALSGSVLLVDLGQPDAPRDSYPALAFLQTVSSAVIALGGAGVLEALAGMQRAAVLVKVPEPTPPERRALWQEVLGPARTVSAGLLDSLADGFALTAAEIRAAVSAAGGPQGGVLSAVLAERLWQSARRAARRPLDDLAQRVETTARWDDLVLPEAQRQTLREITAQVRQRRKVYDAWGMGVRSMRSLGISALFSGNSGTGKSLAAEVLANELNLDLYRIDLSGVVSKYIGETEKNLRRVFDAAENSGAILLFDEADALFGARSEVKDSHDRYANVEVSYLLQRMEAYSGLAILTTNLKNAIDAAFLRRLRFVVNFPFPDQAMRAEIWQRAFPAHLPAEGLDCTRLAQLGVAGGSIRNIALNAAFIAADSGEPLQMRHLLRAARSEYAKLEKTLTESEIAGWGAAP